MSWIKLHRKFLEWEWYSDSRMVQLFVWFLLRASHEETTYKGVRIQRGQLLTTGREICNELKLSPQQLATCLYKLTKTGEINKQSTNKYSIISVCKYDEYQTSGMSDQETNQQTNKKQSNKQARNAYNILNNIQEDKEDKEDIIVVDARAREEDLLKILKSSEIWLTDMQRNHSISRDSMISYIDKFALHCRCRDVPIKTISEAKLHFDNWLRIKLQQDKKQKTNTNLTNINDLWQ